MRVPVHTRVSARAKDEDHVTKIVDLLETSWINPFANGESLVSLSSGAKAPADVSENLLNAQNIGESAYRTFSAERVESNPPSKQFYAPLTKTKLKTFSSMQGKAKKCKVGNKEVVLKADHRIFTHMIIIAQSRQLNLKAVLCHPLGPLPWSLASPNGSMRTTNKSELAKQLLKFPSVVESLQSRSACVIDGMALVQKLNGDGRTFADLAEHALSIVLAEASHSTRIDVVFDFYHESSIKQLERLARGADSDTEVKQIAAGHRVQQWSKFQKNSNNKTNLAVFFLKEWGKDHCRARLNEKVLYTTSKGLCYKLTNKM